MLQLRAKPPVLEPNRFRALIYGDKGVGKTHFACSIPSVYYIDTEGVLKYKKFVDMLKANKSDAVDLTELTEIIKEVKTLLTVKHDYKTLVIDSITFPYASLANMEAERLAEKNKHTEGTEFGANLAKAKRLTFHLSILLTRLDMNVIVTAHEKTKYEKNEEVGKLADINEKMAYALGTTLNLKLMGDTKKAFVEKTRYSELQSREFLDFNDGYETIKSRFGEEIFLRESAVEELASPEQLKELNRLIDVMQYPKEKVDKWLLASKSQSLDEMNTKQIQACIESLNSKIKGE
jgi:hypothetical protein